MNKFNSIFGQILQVFFERRVLQISGRDRGGKKSKRIYLPAAVCGDVVLSIRAGALAARDMRESCRLFREAETSWNRKRAETSDIIICK